MSILTGSELTKIGKYVFGHKSFTFMLGKDSARFILDDPYFDIEELHRLMSSSAFNLVSIVAANGKLEINLTLI